MRLGANDAGEIRRALHDPRALVEALGLGKNAQRQCRNGVTILCPFHSERSPSCSVSLGEDTTVRVHCFGCDASGDALTLIAQVHGFDLRTQFDQVLEEAAKLAGVRLGQPTPKPREPKPAERDQLDALSYQAIATALLERCRLTDELDSLEYVDGRGLIATAAPAQLGGLPPVERQRELIADLSRDFDADALASAGLLWRDRDSGKPQVSRFAHPHNRLVIPWRGLDGSIAVLQRRRLDAGEPRYVFPSGMRPALPFGAEQLRAHGAERILAFVEGALDVLALRLLDRRDEIGLLPLGLPGLDGWRPDWARFAKGRYVWLAFDADDAGERKARVVADDLYDAGALRVSRRTPRGAKDWAELVERGAPPQQEHAS